MTPFIVGLAAFVAFAVCRLLIATRPWHIHVSGRREDGARHELHQGEVPRLGGVALYIAGLTCLTLLSNTIDDATAKLLWSLWACLSMVAAIGMYEDIWRNLPPLVRYFGTAAAALFFSAANGGIGIASVGLAPLDALLSYKLVGALFFVFAVTGVTHAFNLIDGQNGLSSGVALLAYVVLGIVATSTGQSALGILAFTMAGANMGFLLHNYPYGRIFLGDCGAYFNGATIGALAVLIVTGSPLISPWFALTLLIYPVWETLFSMARRRKQSESLFHPDVQHLHHLFFAKDRQSRGWLRHSSAPRLLAFAAMPMGIAALNYSNTLVLTATSLVYIALYLGLYRRLLRASVQGERDKAPRSS
jgi:UDP-N-acetylmuramyl pentapeptide phosphotransferase/UDP-N-acetylglucosamine-1-phosphate transferase